ncbi:unnamed protein product [Spirodela intermedia]|uniref:Gnk2-homologous domain-containing protein n=1 Tax=Spirodela intermedia TaxID=51605 RepID=A0A7I8IX11_SPIIN|nr:unnamed protein product [Spirodela intermedia]CAA6662535.1 unnamed protein product [Spirodela intermedia]
MFYKTTTAGGGGQPSLFGLFQCRGDLSAADCAACTTAARIQLSGCYGLYEISGFPQVSGTKMLYKECGRSGGAGGGFEEKRDTAFASLESAMAAGSAGGFYAAGNGNLRVMAQCEGDLSVADCAECVTESVQKAEVECGGASSGRMYLDKCYLSYGSFPTAAAAEEEKEVVAELQVRSRCEGWPTAHPHDSGGSGHQTGKTVAIVLGSAAAVGFLLVCLLFVRSLYKKDHY